VTPTSTPLTLPSGCGEETQLVPYVPATVPPPNGNYHVLNLTLDTTMGVFWKVNGLAQDIDWSTPSLSYVMNGTYTLPPQDNGITLPDAGWVYLLIINNTPLPHPVHLHGHDFYVLATGAGDGSAAQLSLNNPMRRDTHSVDGTNGQPGPGGYMIVAFQADNPGAWLMHCHIPFHISGGLGVQFLERPSEILGSLGDVSGLTQGCAAWGALQAGANAVVQPDSGLKRRRWAAKL
jgi:FtsP/CotA-like multicopper oxidase with cupredoxin domain